MKIEKEEKNVLHIKNLYPHEERKKWRKVELTTSIILKV